MSEARVSRHHLIALAFAAYPSVAAWFRYQLLADPVGKSWFVGSSCKLCNQPAEWDFFTKGLE